MPWLPSERSAAVTKRTALQPGQYLAAAGTAAANQELVADKLAAPADEDGRQIGQAHPVLLVVVGRRPSEPQAVRPDAGAACGATCAGRLTRRAQSSRNGEVAERQGRSGVGRGAAGAAERLDQTRSEGWTGEERRFERESSAKNVAPRPWLAYTVSAGMAKTEILVETVRPHLQIFSVKR